MAPDCLNLQRVNGLPALMPADLSVPRGSVRTWLFRFIDDDRLPDQLFRFLSADEQKRAAAFVSLSARNQYVQTRAVLRLLLGKFLGLAPESLVFDYGPYGKPSLHAHQACCFNVAHSGDYALLALSDGLQLGVDIERRRHTSDLDALVRMVFSPNELLAWAALHEAERLEKFFSIWAAKEALVKAIGRGLGLGIADLDVGGLPAAVPQGGHRLRVEGFGDCRLMPLSVPPGYAAALALHEPD
ncbi:4'-phosphopantetheinyl transferase superfamily protein [Pusillimonas sp. MFBS29]|uniref:4'-phosphopantetheinyl transferase family protein n=1 Tax=Pusillimonas sp. MFBS29 TaxID=2886690 RepID=UPI001D1028FA|nr:4'-phosphopantetheinyl transferase superfamily protein [Pusillimonas sp. MFBS29]MCC2597575.1 4'-phosphopantetheinyl transferase superfamily protein [Pusillimonas sp. MFBS29]